MLNLDSLVCGSFLIWSADTRREDGAARAAPYSLYGTYKKSMYARKGKKIAARAVHIDPGLHTDKVSKSLIISSPSDIVIFDLQLAIYLDFHKDRY